MNEQRNVKENVKEKENVVYVDLKRLVESVVHKLWLVVLVSVLSAAFVFAGTKFLVTPQYSSAAMFYVNNNSISVGTSIGISDGDITASKNLVDTYIVILDTRETLNAVIDYAGVDYSYRDVADMIEAESVDNTEIFRVTVTNADPEVAEKIADAIAYILPTRIRDIVENTSAKLVDPAVLPSEPSSPNYVKNAILGFLLGLVLSVVVIVIKEMFNVTVRSEEDISQCCKYPVLASVPDMTAPTKGGYYGYGKEKKRTASPSAEPVLLGSGISFAASEAYKLLRTKLQYSFADDNACRVIGVSSALTGEGKSLSAVNLAYSLSQLDKKVLLIDCDMRRPSLNLKLPIHKKPGLSGFLSGQNMLENVIQKCGMTYEESAFDVISSGHNPPNPLELLSSARMVKMLEVLRKSYEYIVLDLPPVSEVSDAIAVANNTDGMLLVVRQNYCDRIALGAAVSQFEFVDTRILGVVYNCISENGGKYGKGYGKKYYSKYGKSYASSYRSASKAAKIKAEEAGQKDAVSKPSEEEK